MAPQPRAPLRSDARDNRRRILAVAGTAFATEGPGVPIREIARRAGVSVATVYRHFPSKDVLLNATFAGRTDVCLRIVAEGVAHDDPWRGFGLVVEKLVAVRARDHGHAAGLPPAVRDRTLRLLLDLVTRAKNAGELRADFVLEDLVLLLMTNEGIHAPTPELTAAASRRFGAIMVRSFRAGPGSATLPPPVRLPPPGTP